MKRCILKMLTVVMLASQACVVSAAGIPYVKTAPQVRTGTDRVSTAPVPWWVLNQRSGTLLGPGSLRSYKEGDPVFRRRLPGIGQRATPYDPRLGKVPPLVRDQRSIPDLPMP